MKLVEYIKSLFKRKNYKSVEESNNIVNSMAKCKSLYKKLAILAHPDKNPNKSELAQEITMSLNENRYNYAKLKELEKRITEDLL